MRLYHFNMFPKKRRYKSNANLDKVRKMPCIVCLAPSPSDPDHFVTRGAGGGDNLGNLNPLCRSCHIKKGSLGVLSFWAKYSDTIIENRKYFGLPPLQTKRLVDPE